MQQRKTQQLEKHLSVTWGKPFVAAVLISKRVTQPRHQAGPKAITAKQAGEQTVLLLWLRFRASLGPAAIFSLFLTKLEANQR